MYFILTIIIIFVILVSTQHYWIVLMLSMGLNGGFIGFQMWELNRVRRNIEDLYQKEKQRIKRKGNNMIKSDKKKQIIKNGSEKLAKERNCEQNTQNTVIKHQKQKNWILKYIYKIFKSIPITQINQTKYPCNGIGITNLIGNYSQNNGHTLYNLSNKQKMSQSFTQIQALQKEKNTKISFIYELMSKQIREMFLSLTYFAFVILLVGYKTISISQLLSNNIHIIVHEMFYQLNRNNMIYIVPLIIGTLWRVQRIYMYIMFENNGCILQQQANNKNISTNDKDNKSNLYLSETTQETPQKQYEDNLQLLLNLMKLQNIAQLLIFIYFVISTLAIILAKILIIPCQYKQMRSICCQIFGENMKSLSIQQQAYPLKFFHFTIYRIFLFILNLAYILIKYRRSQENKHGMKQIFWQFHAIMDKILKFVSTSSRKKYHNRIYRIVKKLKKYRIIQMDFEDADSHIHAKYNNHIVTYYANL